MITTEVFESRAPEFGYRLGITQHDLKEEDSP